jgi:molecular chaperone HscB
MNLQSDDFELFGLPRKFAQERSQIDARWKELQREAHPDRFAAQGAAAQRVAMQWSVRINEAYQRLKDPLKRAAYLCELAGAGAGRRQHGHACGISDAADGVARSAGRCCQRAGARCPGGRDARRQKADAWRMRRLLDEAGDAAAAVQQVRALMFVARFAQDVDRRRDQLGQ